jgi:large subunit ribosomal protein L4
MKHAVVTLENKKLEEIELREDIFGLPVRTDILHKVVTWQLAKRRAGTHKVQVVSEVSGTTKKPFKQKGTGNARQGSLKGPHMVGGGVAHGPVNRDHGYKLNKKVVSLGLKTALSLKLSEGSLKIVDTTVVKSPKTSELKEVFEKAGITNALVVRGSAEQDNFALASRGIKNIDVLPQFGLNVYDILRHKDILITKHALADLQNRL